MSNIQKTLDSLQPYVIGIRYLEGTPLVDAVFKEGWTVPDDPIIKKIKGNEELNYFMLFSETVGVGLDELLEYVGKTIKLNEEREKKHELLKIKVNELKEIFKRTPLTKLTKLKFTFPEEDLVPKLDDFEVDDTFVEEVTETPKMEPQAYLDENKNPIELSDEEQEMLEEEARAERNRKAISQKKNKPISQAVKVELPPKKKIEMAIADSEFDSDCECGPDEACSRCIDKKGL